jgi:predicted dehydrogenase
MGANDRLGLALIGAGRRGTEVAKAFVSDARVDLRCICDIYDVHREGAAGVLGKASLVVAHEEALALRDVDAVLLAVPDHLHLTLAEAALAAGKNLYIEKPTVHRWHERLALQAALARSGKVLQCGTQQRNGEHYQHAKEEIFGGKKLGQVLFARAVWSNFPWQSRHIQPQAKPESLNWNRFLGPARQVPYETVRYDSWRYFPDYGGGVLADILTHWADVAQWMMADAAPESAVAVGGIYGYQDKDGRENPDTVSAIIGVFSGDGREPGFSA